MIKLIIIAVGIGLAANLLFIELFGLSLGGMVVAGYIALDLEAPADVALTLSAAVLTVFIVRLIAKLVILYGRRQFAAMVLTGYLVGISVNLLLANVVQTEPGDIRAAVAAGEAWGVLRTIGFIIPGLVALWMERQGIVVTMCALLTGAVVVRLVLILLLGTEIGPITELYVHSLTGQP